MKSNSPNEKINSIKEISDKKEFQNLKTGIK